MIKLKDNTNLKDKIKLDKTFAALANNISDAIIILNEKGFLIYVNKKASAATGYSTQELLKLSYRDVIHPDELGKISQRFKKRMDGKKVPTHYETIIIGKDKRSIPVNLTSTKVGIDGSNYIILIVHDITKEKRNKELLSSDKEKAQNYLDIAEVIIVIINSDGVVTLINKKGCEILEYSKKEIIGKNWIDNFLPERIRKQVNSVSKKLLAGKVKLVEFYENPILTKSGKEKIISWHNTNIKDKNGNITAILSSGQDITKQKEAEDLIELQYDLITKLNSISNLKKALKVCTDTAIKATGMDCGGVYLVDTKTQEINLSYSKGLPENFIKSASKYSKDTPTAKLVMAGKPIYSQHHKLGIPLDKTSYKEMLLAIAVIPIKHEGSVIAYLNIASHTLSEIPVNTRNILESTANLIGGAIARLIAKETLEKSEEKYRSIFENPIVGTYKSTLDGKYIDANSALVKMLGYPSKKELLSVDIKKDLYCSEKDRPSHNNRKKPFKVHLKRKDDSKIWVEVSSKVIYDNGKPTSYEGIVRNITEQKEAEEALKESEEKYRTLVQALPTRIWLKDLDSVFLSCNRALAKDLGIKPSDIAGKTDYNFFPKKMASKYRKDDKKVIKSGKTADIEETQIQNGKKIDIHTIKTPVVDKDGNIYGTIGAFWDITERKKAEKALKDSEKKFRSLYMTMREGACLHEIIYNNSGKATDYRIIDANKSYESILGLKRRSAIGKKASKVYKTGKPPYLDTYAKVAESGKSAYFETYFSPMDKHLSISVSSPEKGKFATLFSDITDRIKTENQLKYQSFHDGLTGLYNRTYFEEELTRLDTARQIPLSIIIGDVNGLKLINDAFGHAQGDKLLCKCAEVFEKCLRKEDIVARWGGDEFSILLPNTKNDTALKLINRIRLRCTKESSKRMPLSISLGLSTKEKSPQNIEETAREAEGNMYKDKLLERKSITGSIISSLELALFEKEYETKEHIERIKKLSTKLGKAVNLPISELNKLTLISTLHDIGKIAIPYEILFKKDRLLKKEWAIIKKHSEIGNNICKSSSMLSHIAEDILHHHEWWDGSGYPKKLKGKDIPITTRIISIIDAYDVMRYGRPYRKAINKKEAIKELKRCAGTQFSPSLVKKFIKIIKK